MTSDKKEVIIGTRGSKLALWQAEHVKSRIEAIRPGISVSLDIIKTKGDKILDVPLAKVGGKGLFVKEIETALLDGNVDLAVHSMKDMPSELPEGLMLSAVPEREDPVDVLISREGISFKDLPKGAVIGTSSLRRAAQILAARPDMEIRSLRGNLDTRLKKLETENLSAIVLAAAGVKRLGYTDRITEYFDVNVMLPAVGQGALAIESRIEDPFMRELLDKLEHSSTRIAVTGERAFLKTLEGGCQVPIAAHGVLNGNTYTLTGLVAETDGSLVLKEEISGPPETAEHMGIELGKRLLEKGADKILEKVYNDNAL